MKILMVCLGNICRSPLAHGIMQHLVEAQGLDWEIDSAGTGDWHVGQCPDRRSIAVAKKYGIDISTQRAQQFQPSFFQKYDLILVMDRSNYRNVTRMAQLPDEVDKVRLFLGAEEVPDPYYDDQLFEPVYQQVYARCETLLQELLAQEGIKS
jgi:protein-tyrosine phosphatase